MKKDAKIQPTTLIIRAFKTFLYIDKWQKLYTCKRVAINVLQYSSITVISPAQKRVNRVIVFTNPPLKNWLIEKRQPSR